MGGYGLAKGGFRLVNLARMAGSAGMAGGFALIELQSAQKGLLGAFKSRAGQLSKSSVLDVPKGGLINGNSIWTPGKRGDSVSNAFLHWKDHGYEFSGFQNAKQYVEHAHNLFRDQSVLRRIRSSDGACLCYNPSTNTFGSFTVEGVPKTMFKPGISKPLRSKHCTPLEYFYGQ